MYSFILKHVLFQEYFTKRTLAMKKIIFLYNMPTKAKKLSTFGYKCSEEDETPVGTVEPCAGTDTDEPSCGIAILDTDGEWIEMKGSATKPEAKRVYGALLQRNRMNLKSSVCSRLR